MRRLNHYGRYAIDCIRCWFLVFGHFTNSVCSESEFQCSAFQTHPKCVCVCMPKNEIPTAQMTVFVSFDHFTGHSWAGFNAYYAHLCVLFSLHSFFLFFNIYILFSLAAFCFCFCFSISHLCFISRDCIVSPMSSLARVFLSFFLLPSRTLADWMLVFYITHLTGITCNDQITLNSLKTNSCTQLPFLMYNFHLYHFAFLYFDLPFSYHCGWACAHIPALSQNPSLVWTCQLCAETERVHWIFLKARSNRVFEFSIIFFIFGSLMINFDAVWSMHKTLFFGHFYICSMWIPLDPLSSRGFFFSSFDYIHFFHVGLKRILFLSFFLYLSARFNVIWSFCSIFYGTFWCNWINLFNHSPVLIQTKHLIYAHR